MFQENRAGEHVFASSRSLNILSHGLNLKERKVKPVTYENIDWINYMYILILNNKIKIFLSEYFQLAKRAGSWYIELARRTINWPRASRPAVKSTPDNANKG